MELLIPEPLKKGDLIGVVAPSGPPDIERLEKGSSYLVSKGFRIALGKHIFEKCGYLAGTDTQRSDDLNDMLARPDIRAVVFARGGYGMMRILDLINHESLLKDPKIIMGMSDITALSLSLFHRIRLCTFAGPMVAVDIANDPESVTERSLMAALTLKTRGRDLFKDMDGVPKVLREGKCSGPLLGGCLSLVTSLMGGGHLPHFEGSILFLEDINEPLYRLDRMLVQLKLGGITDRVSAIILGHFTGSSGEDQSAHVEAVVADLVERDIPIISGLAHGHKLPNLTVPHGFTAALEARAQCASLLIQ